MDAMYGDANTGYIKMRASMKDGKYEYRIINACSKINEFVPDQRLGVKNITAGLMRNVRTLSVVMQPARTLIRLPSTTAAPIWQSRK